MRKSARQVLVSACLATFILLAACDKPPVDATIQADDYPMPVKPDYRLQPVRNRSFGPCSPQIVRHLVDAYPRPDMMALGGSVFNGVSSMHINWWLADWSPPAQLARALSGGATEGPVPGLRVAPYPDYGADPFGWNQTGDPTFRLGLDLETTNLSSLGMTVRRQGWLMSRFKTYTARADNGPFVDNLSFAGAAISDVLYGTPRDYRRRLEAVRRIDTIAPDADKFWSDGPRARSFSKIIEHAKTVHTPIDIGKTAGALVPIFFAENSSFVLNPTQDSCLEDMTALDQVLLRQPKRLLVGVGSNSGLFTFLYTGQPVDRYCGDVDFAFGEKVYQWKRYVSIRQSSGQEFLGDMAKLLDKLATEGGRIEHIYVMAQLRPSSIANLKPSYGQSPPGLHRYFASYDIDFAPEGGITVSGEEVERADKLNSEVNQKLRELVEARNKLGRTRFIFVDLDAMADRYDFKHTGNPHSQIVIGESQLAGLQGEIRLDNRVLTFSRSEQLLGDGSSAGQRILEGGMFSLDNLHPTVVGYSALATELLKAIKSEEGITLAAGAEESISPPMAYARLIRGNVLRRHDKGLATREDWLQAAFDLAAGGSKARRLDCWPR